MRAMEQLAEELVDGAIADMSAELGAPLPPRIIEQLRWSLLDELLLTPDGRMRLRRALGDPEVERSDVVGAGVEDEEAAGE
jgi:hypothetical protein